MRATTAFNHLLDLEGVRVRDVAFADVDVTATLVLCRRRLVCPHCDYSTRARYDKRPVDSVWRHLDLGRWLLVLKARLRRLRCPTHGVVTEGVPFARPGARFSRDFEDLVAYLATTMDKTAIRRLCRVDWDTVGRITERVVDEKLDPDRLKKLFVIGVDEVSWRKGQKYVTLVSDHVSGKIVWGAEGKDSETLGKFFDALEPEVNEQLQAVSMDMSAAFLKGATEKGHAPNAVICFDSFHVAALGSKALEVVRRGEWRELLKLDPAAAKRFKGARWCLLKNPGDLDEKQAATLRKLRAHGGAIWRAYTLKEALRSVFAGDLSPEDVGTVLDRFCSKASRSGLPSFVKLAKTIRKHREGIMAAVNLRVNNGRHEGLNRRVRMIIDRAYGLHSAEAALALIMVTLGPITHVLPYEKPLRRNW